MIRERILLPMLLLCLIVPAFTGILILFDGSMIAGLILGYVATPLAIASIAWMFD